MINIHHSLSFWDVLCMCTGSLLKTHMHIVLTTILLQFYFIFFLAGTIDSLTRSRGKQNLHDWYVCFHVVIVINIEKSCRDLSHTRGKLYACTRRFGLCFMSRTNKAVAIRWLATTTTTTKSCDQHLCIIIQPFSSHLFLAHIRLSWPRCPWWCKWCDLNFQGGGQGPEVCWNRLHHFQEDEMMARACVLAFCLLSGWKKIEVEIGNIHNLNFNNCVII